jgi:sugar-phosphatase
MLTMLGLVAGALTTACWLPQIGRSRRTRSTGDVSWAFLVAVATGISLWFVYGLASGHVAIIVANGLTLLAIGTMAVLKARFDRQPALPPLLATVEAVLLDMDGTLIDSDAAVERTWTTWARRTGVDEAFVLATTPGKPATTVLREIAPHLSDAAIADTARELSELQRADLGDVVAAPGTTTLLDVLAERRVPWAIVTSADRRLARAQLSAVGIHPPALVTVDDVAHGKPHPEGYLCAAAILGADPSACLVVEDSAAGIAAGQAAGMRVAALRGFRADLPIENLDQLADWLRVPR